MKKYLAIAVLLSLLSPFEARALSPVYLPNLGETATGTTVGSDHGLDVNMIGGTLTESATAADAGSLPALLKIIGGYDGTNTQVIKTDAAGELQIDVLTSALPSGAATSANQSTANASLSSIDGKITAVDTGAVVVSSSALPSGAATAAKQPALGTAGTPSADVISIQGTGSGVPVRIDGSGTTQPVSAVSLPLPTGASTSAAQTTGNASLASIDGKITAVNTGAVVVSSSALPSGAATSANQTTANSSLSSIDGKFGSLGQKAMTGSAPVVIASDQSALQIKAAVNANGSGSAASATVSTVIALTAPASAAGFILQNLDTSTANVRWSIGRTATTLLGQQLQPGRDTGFIPAGANVSIVSESGTQNYDIQWVTQ